MHDGTQGQIVAIVTGVVLEPDGVQVERRRQVQDVRIPTLQQVRDDQLRPETQTHQTRVTTYMLLSTCIWKPVPVTSVFLSVLFSNHWKTKLYLITWIRYILLQFILPSAGVVMLCPTTQISHSISLKGGASFFLFSPSQDCQPYTNDFKFKC